jgi:hypothetical protein
VHCWIWGVEGVVGNVEAASDHHPVCASTMGRFHEDARELGAVDEEIVRPFQCQALGRLRCEGRNGIDHRHGRDEAELAGAPRLDEVTEENGCVEVALRRGPGPPAPAASRGLLAGRDPQPILAALEALRIRRAHAVEMDVPKAELVGVCSKLHGLEGAEG